MNEFDAHGWAQIHYSAFRGFVKSIKNFVSNGPEQLEQETQDELHSTPLLLAVIAGQIEAVKCLLELGANVSVENSQSHGIIELATLKQNVNMLRFFLSSKTFDKLPVNQNKPNGSSTYVWQRLLKLLCSIDDEESVNAGACLRILLDPGPQFEMTVKDSDDETIHPFWTEVVDVGLIACVIKVIKSDLKEAAKTQAFLTLLHLMHLKRVREQFVNSGGVAALVPLLRSESVQLVLLSARVLGGMARGAQEHARTMVQAGLLPSLVKVLTKWSVMPVEDDLHSLHHILGHPEADEHDRQSPQPILKRRQKDELIREVVQTLGIVCEDNDSHQIAASKESECFKLLVGLYHDCVYKGLLMALTVTVTHLVKNCDTNQLAMLDADVGPHLITLVRVKDSSLQLAAVEAIDALVEGNAEAQHRMLMQSVTVPLLAILRRNRSTSNIREATARALWSLAGNNSEEKRRMANAIGAAMLVEFLQSQSMFLHLIGCEAIAVLCKGPTSQANAVGQQGGVQGLVTLLRSDKEQIVTRALIALRHACLGIAYQPHTKNQSAVMVSRGIRFLVALMVYAREEEIRAEAAYTLAAVSLGNASVLSEIQSHPEFSFIRILKMLYHENKKVKILAGNALATFAYNSASQQRIIASMGGVAFSSLLQMLRSMDEEERCQASFQVVILSRVIPDEEQAISSAAGIKLLVDLIFEATDRDLQALSADCVSRLAHTRAGVAQAMVSINVVEGLCSLARSDCEFVSGSAAVALVFLSHNPDARRRILNQCRREPKLMNVIERYQSCLRSDPKFKEGWQHIKKVGLPAIHTGRAQMTVSKSLDYFHDPGNRQLTMFSVDDDPIASAVPPPMANKPVNTNHLSLLGRDLSTAIVISGPAEDSNNDNNTAADHPETQSHKDPGAGGHLILPELGTNNKKKRDTVRVSFAETIEVATTVEYEHELDPMEAEDGSL